MILRAAPAAWAGGCCAIRSVLTLSVAATINIAEICLNVMISSLLLLHWFDLGTIAPVSPPPPSGRTSASPLPCARTASAA